MLLNGIAWRALPSEFGNWNTSYQFWNRLARAGFSDFLEQFLVCGQFSEAVFFDSTHVKLHQHANGPGSPVQKAVGTSRGGKNTKIHAMVDIFGRLSRPLIFTGANKHDSEVAPQLLEGLEGVVGVGDKAYDSKKIRAQLAAQHCEPCIPSRSNAKEPAVYDKTLYRARHAIENFFQKLKVFRRMSQRFEKTLHMFRLFANLCVSAVYVKTGVW